MKNLILLLVLISGFLSGYLIGDFRGSSARESLKKAVETGNTLASERETALTLLKAELDGINDKHHRELEAIRKGNASRVSEWRRTKNGLNDQLEQSTANLAELDVRLKSVIAQRDTASGSSKTALDLEIARLQKERADLQRELNGNACLQARIPHRVSDTLNETKVAGGK